MGEAKIRRRAAFADELIEAWEARDCVDFAIALARRTGWLLHVDWWSNSTEHQDDMPVEQLRPMRVYVADDRHRIFDVRGVKSFVEFSDHIIWPLAVRMRTGNGGVYTRYYGEKDLASLPLRARPDEARIARASEAIAANPGFLAAIPPRKPPNLPAHKAAWFSLGRCAAYAEALHEQTGLPVVGLIAMRFSALHGGPDRPGGYVHSVATHPDGMAEDAWGKASLSDIAERFGVVEFTISRDAHRSMVASIRRNSEASYIVALDEARELVRRHRL